MNVYYAHPISIYDTHQELRDIALLNALGFDVVNPNQAEHDAGYKSYGMAYFTGIVCECDALAFRAFPDGSIPAGVLNEIRVAQEHGKPVFELPSAVSRRGLSVEATREALKECGCR